jgi:hypothetical protein
VRANPHEHAVKTSRLLPRCAAIALAACNSSKINDSDRATLERAIAASKAEALQVVAARTAALNTAKDTPPATSGACTFPLPPADALIPPPGGGPPKNGEAARTAKLHFSIVPAWALDGTPAPKDRSEREVLWATMGLSGTNHGQYELAVNYIKDEVARGSYDAGEDAAKLSTTIGELGARYFDWELVIVTTEIKLAKQTGDATFASGEIAGSAFVWSYADRKIRCAGPVHATNSDSVMSIKVDRALATGDNGFLTADLEAQAFAAAVRGMHDVSR